MTHPLRSVWRELNRIPLVRRTTGPVVHRVLETIALPPPPFASRDGAIAPGDIVVSGFRSDRMGLGRSARFTGDALDRAGFSVVRHNLDSWLSEVGLKAGQYPSSRPGGVWLMHANPEECAAAFARLPQAAWRDRYRIGYWFWETPEAPKAWRRMAGAFHEIWAASPFVRDALATIAPTVRVMPVPVTAPSGVAPDRSRWSLQDRRAWALTIADPNSSFTRKNPAAAIAAFLAAFPEPSPEAGLVIKLRITEGTAPPDWREAVSKVQSRPDVRIIEGALSDEGIWSLLASADVFLSLHRAEGFGLGLAEAMVLGKPVLATGWSGNMGFMSGDQRQLAPYTLRRMTDPTGVYRGRALWAEPNIEEAAVRLRALLCDQALARDCGDANRANAARTLLEPWTRETLVSASWAEKAALA